MMLAMKPYRVDIDSRSSFNVGTSFNKRFASLIHLLSSPFSLVFNVAKNFVPLSKFSYQYPTARRALPHLVSTIFGGDFFPSLKVDISRNCSSLFGEMCRMLFNAVTNLTTFLYS